MRNMGAVIVVPYPEWLDVRTTTLASGWEYAMFFFEFVNIQSPHRKSNYSAAPQSCFTLLECQ